MSQKFKSFKNWFFFIVPTLVYVVCMIMYFIDPIKYVSMPFSTTSLLISWAMGGTANVVQKKILLNSEINFGDDEKNGQV